MATIDSNIALGVKPLQVENPMNQYAALSQIQNAQNQNMAAQNQNALAQYQLSSAKRGDEKVNFLNQSFAKNTDPTTGKINYAGVYSDAAQNGFGSELPNLVKAQQEAQKQEGAIKKQDLEVQELEFNQRIKKANKAVTDIINLNTPQEAIAGVKRHLASGDINQVKADQLIQSIEQTPNFRQWQKTTAMNILDVKDKFEVEHKNRIADIAGGNLVVNQGQLAIAQNKANREQTMGTIPAGYRLAADGKTLEAMPGGPTTVALPPKEIQKREALFPQAQQSVKTVSNTMSVIGQTVDSLLANETGIDRITGLISGNTPAITDSARKAKAEVEQLKNLAFVQGITELRAASKTGAGVGNVTNREGDRFENLKASLDRAQSKEDFIAALKKLKQQAEITSQYTNEAFNETYDYRNNAGATQQAPLSPTAPAPSNAKKPSLNEIFRSPPKPQ